MSFEIGCAVCGHEHLSLIDYKSENVEARWI